MESAAVDHEEEYLEAYSTLWTLIHPHMQKALKYLDYGSGKGRSAWMKARIYPMLEVVSYDPRYEISPGSNPYNFTHVSSFDEVRAILSGELMRCFDIATACLSMHEAGQRGFREMLSVLGSGAIIGVMDYDLYGASMEKFLSLFATNNEELEIRNIGVDMAYRIHTSFGLDVLTKWAEQEGCETIKAEKVGSK